MVKKNKIILILFIISIMGIFMFAFINHSEVEAEVKTATRKEGIENFPDSYKPYLEELQKKYPNWKFVALYTNLDWKYVIDNENEFGKNLVPKSYSDNWKNTTPGQYNIEVDAGWVDCSRRALEYTMDPRNFLNYVRVFQFEGLSYDSKTNNKDGIEKILYGTEFYNRTVSYLNSSGATITTTSKYSDLILSAAKTSGVSSYHLASRIKQEVGPFLSHSSISGDVAGYKGLYNFYNIGATSSSEPMGAIKNGLQYAKDGKGASQTIKDKYLIPWNTKAKAITGGAIFIGSSYIHLGQDTLYLQKFHVVDNSSNELFWHQYMTNVLAPYSESTSIYKGYVNTGLLSGSMTFIIPVYNNMPEIPMQSPAIKEEDYTSDNTRVYANVDTTLNIRSGPSTSYEVLTSVSKNTRMTRIAKGKQSGELWDRVKLDNGMVGYVSQNYVKEANLKVTDMNLNAYNLVLQEGDNFTIIPTIIPNDAINKNVNYDVNNRNIVQVDSSGKINALSEGEAKVTVTTEDGGIQKQVKVTVIRKINETELSFDNSLTVNANDITGWNTSEMTVEDIKGKITTIYDIEIYNSKGKVLQDDELAGTGSTIRIIEDGKTIIEFNIIVYGDTNGDGRINSVDLLVLQRHILEKEQFAGVFLKAGNISKNGKKPSSTDLLLIQRHILQIQAIKQ